MYIFLIFNVYFRFYAFFIVILHKYWKIIHDIKKVYCNFIQIKGGEGIERVTEKSYWQIYNKGNAVEYKDWQHYI